MRIKISASGIFFWTALFLPNENSIQGIHGPTFLSQNIENHGEEEGESKQNQHLEKDYYRQIHFLIPYLHDIMSIFLYIKK